MYRRRAASGRTASSRIGRPLLGSAAAHFGLLGALLMLGAASGPLGDGAVQVLLVGEAVPAATGGAERVLAPAGDTARTAAVPPGEAKVREFRPSPSPAVPAAVRAPDASGLPAAEKEAVPAPAAPPSPALPVSSPGAAPPGQYGEARAAGPRRAAGPVAGADEGGSAAAGGPGGAGKSRAAGGGSLERGVSTSLAALRARIEERIVYPPEAVRRGQEGEVLLRIRIGVGGIPQEIRIARSSGARVLDEAARSGVVRASPLPSRPGWVEVPVRFSLR